MFKVNDYVIYQKDVCKIIAIDESIKDMSFYVLIPLKDNSLKITITMSSPNLRPLMSKKELKKLIERIPFIAPIMIDDKAIEKEYQLLFDSEEHENLIKIIKTVRIRTKERLENKKQIGDRENNCLSLAEEYLYNEISIVSGTTFESTKEYITKLIEE